MSEPMSNREIEDVLTSIRRLVAQEGTRGTESGRLILTPAQRIPDTETPADTAVSPVEATPAAADVVAQVSSVDEVPEAPMLDDMATPTTDSTIPAPDFGKLEATIAELEAAVSASGEDSPEDGAETAEPDASSKGSNVTELYGKLSFMHRGKDKAPGSAPDSAVSADAPAEMPAQADAPFDSVPDTIPVAAAPLDPAAPEVAVTATEGAAQPAIEAAAEAAEASAGAFADAALREPARPEDDAEAREWAAFDGDSLIETIMDEDMLRELVAQMIREELHGQLGERITLQVRKLVRAEVAKALEDRNLL